MKNIRTAWIAVALGVALLAGGCRVMFKGKEAAEQGVADFHRLYNENKLAEIYANSHADLKNASPTFAHSLEKVPDLGSRWVACDASFRKMSLPHGHGAWQGASPQPLRKGMLQSSGVPGKSSIGNWRKQEPEWLLATHRSIVG